jgi:hypothetical protein
MPSNGPGGLLKTPRVILGFFILLSLYSGALYAFAITYVPQGTVLDPAGLPGSYTVTPGLSYAGPVTSGHDNEVLYVDGSGNLASDAFFSRDSVTQDTFVTYGSGTVLAGFATNSAGASLKYSDSSLGLDTTVTTTPAMVRIRYRDTNNNILAREELNSSGNSLLWDADTTDDLTDAIEQSENVGGYGLKGTGISRTDSNTGLVTGFFAGDATIFGFDAMTSYLSSGRMIAAIMPTIFNVGDLLGGGNSTTLTIDDIAQTITAQTTGNVFLGDITGSANSTGIAISDSAQSVGIRMNNDFSINRASGGFTLLKTNFSDLTANLGDVNGGGNNTLFSVNDLSTEISAQTSSYFSVYDTSGHAWLQTSAMQGVSLGDLAGTQNSTQFLLNDATRTIRSNVNGAFNIINPVDSSAWLNTDTSLHQVNFGDFSTIYNHTFSSLDDTTSTSIINGNRGISASSPVFTGIGLDDFGRSGYFSGPSGTAYSVTISNTAQPFLIWQSGTESGTLQPGDTITGGTTGSVAVVSSVYAPGHITVLVSDTGGWMSGEPLTASPSGWTANYQSGGIVDTFDWTDGTTTVTGMPTLSGGVEMSYGILASFGSSTGHDLNDNWTFDYTITFGRMFSLDGMNHRFVIGDVNEVAGGMQIDLNNDTNQLKFKFGSGVEYTFPSTNSAGSLTNDGFGGLTWSPAVGSSITAGQVGYGDPSNNLISDANFTWDPSAHRFLVGDLSDSVNKTKFYVLDDGASITATAANFQVVDPVHTGRNFYLDSNAQRYKLGDIDGVGNGLVIDLDDQTNRSISIGNVSNSQNGTYATMDDNNQAWSFVSKYNSVPNTDFLTLNWAQGYATLGDRNGSKNGTHILVDDASQYISIDSRSGIFVSGDVTGTANGSILSINDSVGLLAFTTDSHNWFKVFGDGVGVAQMGDIDGSFNHTYIEVDDSSTLINNYVNGHFYVSTPAGNKIIDADTTNRSITLGDADNNNNGNFIVVDDANRDIRMRVTATAGFWGITESGGSVGTVLSYSSPERRVSVVGTRFETAKGADVAAANTMTLGSDGNTFTITGNTQINLINGTNWQQGAQITLIFTGTPTIKNNQTGSGGNLPLLLAGNSDLTVTDVTTITFVRNGGSWQEIARSFNNSGFQVNAPSAYAANIINSGDNANRYGIQIRAGANDASGTTYYINALDGDGDQVGYIANTSGTFALTDVSDIRTKTNIADTGVHGLDTINALRVVDFNRLSHPNDSLITGFIAQEVQGVYPQAVTQGADGLLGISKDTFVPVLVKAIQEMDLKIKPLDDLLSENNTFAELLRTFLADAMNGVEKIFSKEVVTDKLCVQDEEGQTCLTRSELDALIAGGSGSVPQNGSGGGGSATTTGEENSSTSGEVGATGGDIEEGGGSTAEGSGETDTTGGESSSTSGNAETTE